jgi:hypothetical protein
MMAEQPKATGGYQYTSKRTGVPETPALASPKASTRTLPTVLRFRRELMPTGWDMHAEVGLFLMGVGTSLILLALIGLIWWMVPR